MDFWTAIERLGFPIVAAGALAWFIWKMFKWLGEKVVEPIAKSHIALVDSAKESNAMNAKTLESIGGVMQQKAVTLDKIATQNDQILNLAQKNHDLLSEMKQSEA